ncbi:MAG TPA: hypothetical protein VGD58_32940 [Herpetosiphonaceae bacterium]
MSTRTTKRQRLAAARIALRDAQDHHDLIKAQAEHRIIENAGGAKNLGANADDRTRAVTLALANDPAYCAALAALREAQAEVDRMQADVDDAIDQRRKLDRQSRDRASAALEALALLPPDRVPLALVDTTRIAA